jgi:hypothetical protein
VYVANAILFLESLNKSHLVDLRQLIENIITSIENYINNNKCNTSFLDETEVMNQILDKIDSVEFALDIENKEERIIFQSLLKKLITVLYQHLQSFEILDQLNKVI